MYYSLHKSLCKWAPILHVFVICVWSSWLVALRFISGVNRVARRIRIAGCALLPPQHLMNGLVLTGLLLKFWTLFIIAAYVDFRRVFPLKMAASASLSCEVGVGHSALAMAAVLLGVSHVLSDGFVCLIQSILVTLNCASVYLLPIWEWGFQIIVTSSGMVRNSGWDILLRDGKDSGGRCASCL